MHLRCILSFIRLIWRYSTSTMSSLVDESAVYTDINVVSMPSENEALKTSKSNRLQEALKYIMCSSKALHMIPALKRMQSLPGTLASQSYSTTLCNQQKVRIT